MNKFVCTVLLLTGIVSSTWAQVSLVPKAGYQSGPNCLRSGQIVKTLETRGVFVGGVGVLIRFAVQVIFAATRGAVYSERVSTRCRLIDMTVNYLEIPVMGRFSVGSKQTRGYLGVGPSYGYAIGGKSRGADGKEVKLTVWRRNGRDKTL